MEPSTTTKSRCHWFELNGKKALSVDFSHASVAESLALVRDFDRMLIGQASQSVLVLTNVTDADYDPSVARQWKEARNRHDDLIRAGAIFGLNGLVGIAIRGFIEARRFLGMSEHNAPRIFADGDQARAWLAQQ